MITIRQASPDDWIDVSILLQDFHAEVYENIPEMMEVYSRLKVVLSYMNMAERDIPFAIFLAYDGDSLIGMSGGKMTTHNWMKTRWGIEDFWFVKEEYRNGKNNVGIKLYNKLINWFKENGAEKISMTRFTFAENIDKFYRKKGFVPYEITYVKDVKEL